ncbi:hypothetical protein NPIL_148921 [Nephila pilipes]|uniref:Uncharacterized protein n=1 Tax=Nephila pilipes TaxID=299642 RepID=A0A8X6UA67_NEPPI|nr:hypothetical protein NPIL_148921 [Nephila pilipes]
MSTNGGVHGYVPVPCAVSKKLASDLLLSTAAYEAIKENVQVYGSRITLDVEDVHVAGEEVVEDPSKIKKLRWN